MKEKHNILLFYVSIALLFCAAIIHGYYDPPVTTMDWASNIALMGAVMFLVTVTILFFRPQIRLVAQFKARAALLETVIRSANDGIIITKSGLSNPGPEVIYVNEAFTQISGYSAEEMIGQSPRILQNEFTKRETLDEMKQALSEGKPFKGELLNVHKSGRQYWLDISIVPVKNAMGEVTHFAAIERDITEKKSKDLKEKDVWVQLKRANMKAEAAARDLEESLKKAEEANIAKGDFLANMSHELRTPMNGVLGMASLLGDTELSAEQQEYVSTINSSGESLLMLLNDILDFSKIEAGALELENIAYNFPDTIEKTANLLHPQVEKKGIELRVDCEANVPQYAHMHFAG